MQYQQLLYLLLKSIQRIDDIVALSYGYAYSNSKGNHNSTDDTAMETNSVGHSFNFGHDGSHGTVKTGAPGFTDVEED